MRGLHNIHRANYKYVYVRESLKKFGLFLVYKGQEYALCDTMVDTDFQMKLGLTVNSFGMLFGWRVER